MRRIFTIVALLIVATAATAAEVTGVPTLKFDPSVVDLLVFGLTAGAGATGTKIFYDHFWGDDSEPAEVSYRLRVMHPSSIGKYLENTVDLPYKPSSGMGLILADNPEIEAVVKRVSRPLDPDEDDRCIWMSLVNPIHYKELGKDADWQES